MYFKIVVLGLEFKPFFISGMFINYDLFVTVMLRLWSEQQGEALKHTQSLECFNSIYIFKVFEMYKV